MSWFFPVLSLQTTKLPARAMMMRTLPRFFGIFILAIRPIRVLERPNEPVEKHVSDSRIRPVSFSAQKFLSINCFRLSQRHGREARVSPVPCPCVGIAWAIFSILCTKVNNFHCVLTFVLPCRVKRLSPLFLRFVRTWPMGSRSSKTYSVYSVLAVKVLAPARWLKEPGHLC